MCLWAFYLKRDTWPIHFADCRLVEAFGRYVIVKCSVPVRISGETCETVEVNPDDFIFGEEDGVIVIPKDLILPVLAECERIKGLEDLARVDFARGDDPVEVFQRYKRF